MKCLTLPNGITLELCERDGKFTGIGAVKVDEVVLRNERQPAFVEIWTPTGIAITDFEVATYEVTPDRAEIWLTAKAEPSRLMEWMLHEARPRLNTIDYSLEPQPALGTSLRLIIESAVRKLGDAETVGFRYQYHYKSAQHPIYKILDKASWEIGGEAQGNTFLLRNSFAPSIFPVRDSASTYSTEWYLPAASNPSVFQFLPWQTALEGFTMTAHAAGTVLTWATEVGHIRSLFEIRAGENSIRHWHEHCADLSSDFSTIPIEVLWMPGATERVRQLNLHESMRDFVSSELHSQIGMRRERVSSYGVIEEWGLPDLARYKSLGLPKLRDAGVKTVFIPSEFENNMNTFGVENICCTVDYKVAESVGEDSLRSFCETANNCGMTVEMWGNTALSTLTYILAQREGPQARIDFLPVEGSIVDVIRSAKDPWTRNAFGSIEADHYTPQFAQLNLRDPDIRVYWMRQWKYAHDKIGLRQIFLDSSFNMSSDKFHWIANRTPYASTGGTVDQVHLLGTPRPAVEPPSAIQSQYRAHLDLMVEMQRSGYVYCAEDIGVFGIHRTGPGIAARLDNMALWSDCLGLFDVLEIRRHGADPNSVYFEGLAYRLVWQIHWDIERDELTFHGGARRCECDAPTAWHLSILKAYNQVVQMMDKRTILPDETGVLYSDLSGTCQVLWALRALELPISRECLVTNILTGQTLPSATLLKAVAQQVFIISIPT